MASFANQFITLRCPSFPSSYLSKRFTAMQLQTQKLRLLPIVSAVGVNDAETRERLKLKQLFEEARDRCEADPMYGVSFTLEDFEAALKKYDVDIQIGSVVRGTVDSTDEEGAFVDIRAKSSAYLPLDEACIHEIEHVHYAGVVHGMTEDFLVIDQNADDDSFLLSLKSIQYDIAWERCRQLQAEDAVVKGKVVEANSGGLVVQVESLEGFVPFSQISMRSDFEKVECVGKEIPLKFVDVDEEQSTLVLSNRKVVADIQTDLGVGSVVIGTVQSIKPFGAFVDIGGIVGLLHVSQISHDRVTDITTVLHTGDNLKVMILSLDRERGRLSLSTKKLEPTPGDMIRNPQLVFEKADEMGQTFRQRMLQAEALARADMLRFQPENDLPVSKDGILGILGVGSDAQAEPLDLRDLPRIDE